MTRNRKCFTLIELIMTIVILGIISLSLSLVICQYISSFARNNDLTSALQFARLEMENTTHMDYADIVNASFPNYRGYAYDLNRTVTYKYSGSRNSLKQIVIEAYPQGETQALTKFTTYRAKRASF